MDQNSVHAFCRCSAWRKLPQNSRRPFPCEPIFLKKKANPTRSHPEPTARPQPPLPKKTNRKIAALSQEGHAEERVEACTALARLAKKNPTGQMAAWLDPRNGRLSKLGGDGGGWGWWGVGGGWGLGQLRILVDLNFSLLEFLDFSHSLRRPF